MTATITGSGFGAVQGESKVMMLDSESNLIVLTPTSWAAGVITATVPTGTPVGNAVVVVQLGGESLGTRSPGACEVRAELIAPPSDYEAATFTLLRVGTQGEVAPPPELEH